MSTLTRWNPTRAFFGPSLINDFDRLFGTLTPRLSGGEDVSETSWVPAADIKETEKALHVELDLPGLAKEDIDISLEDNVLTVSGERRFVKEETKQNVHRMERFYGKFSRSFRLSRNVDRDGVKATFRDGVLALELPKTPEAQARQIKIH